MRVILQIAAFIRCLDSRLGETQHHDRLGMKGSQEILAVNERGCGEGKDRLRPRLFSFSFQSLLGCSSVHRLRSQNEDYPGHLASRLTQVTLELNFFLNSQFTFLLDLEILLLEVQIDLREESQFDKVKGQPVSSILQQYLFYQQYLFGI
jgi:hypothetical protein